MDKERSVFSFEVTEEQLNEVEKIVQFSIENHKIANIFDDKFQYEYRTTGSLGEICFADLYHLERPTKSYGAVDGQDMGKDFELKNKVIDIKSMRRKNENFYDDYVFNIPASQLEKEGSKTNYYCHISVSRENDKWRAAVIGYVEKDKILTGQLGQRYQCGTMRKRADKTNFIFTNDTYEVLFSELKPPIITDEIQKLPGFRLLKIKKSKKYENKNS